VKQYAAPDFWVCYRRLPTAIRVVLDKSFELLQHEPWHPSIQSWKVDSVEVFAGTCLP